MPRCLSFKADGMGRVQEIIGKIAREQRVEQIILRIAGLSALTQELKDLSQMVYLALLEYDEDKITDLWESDAINFLIVRLVLFNLHSKTSRYYYVIRKFSSMSDNIALAEYKTADER